MQSCEWLRRGARRGLAPPARTLVWSPLEYCCHLRDVLVTQRERVVRILVEECPTVLPMHRDERAVLTRYAEEDTWRALGQLRVAADMAAWTFAPFGASQWTRGCLYNHPEPATRSLGWLGRHTVHEAAHHLMDVRRIVGRSSDRHRPPEALAVARI
jgi:DNA segregation ATPase FtsK/SpoIIIE, S-DNA-T family